MGSHPSLGEAGRRLLRELLHRYRHVFPAPGEPVTGRTTSVQHEILTLGIRLVRCGPRPLAPAGLQTEQTCVKEMLLGGQIEPSDRPWASSLVLVTKKDGSTCFCVDYRRLNSLTTKDDGRFLLDTDASLVAVGGVLNQIQDDREVVFAYASRSLRLSQRRYCMTRREMLAAVVMCTHFRSYHRGAQFTLCTDNSSLRWLQKFCDEDGMLVLVVDQCSVTFEYRPGAQHANADRMSRQCGQCWRPDCPVSSSDSQVAKLDASSVLLDQPFASSKAIPWTQTCCWNCRGRPGWQPRCWRNLRWTYLQRAWILILLWHPVRMRLLVRSGSGLVRVRGIFPGITLLAITDWQSVGGYGGEIMVSTGSSVGSFSASCTGPGASGYDPQISLFTFRQTFGSFPDNVSATESGLLAGVASRRSFLPGIIIVLFVWHVSLRAHGGLPWDMLMWGNVGIG